MAPVPGMFDVFLNHRGPDVKQNFAAHLHQALQEAGCRPFLDMESLEKGQHGQKKIYEALACASVHVAIFSKHYADSNYCLDELCAMLERKKLIIPVFYDVSPNDLHCKLHNGPYTKAFRETHGRRPASEVKKWKDALCMAAQLFGFQLANYNGDEAQLKTAIVSKVRDHLRASQLSLVAPYQVGLEETSKELIETLNSMEKDVGVLSLVGMGGIGKTTLAKEIYCRFEKNDMFEKNSFLMCVRESAILDLQKQVARDLFGEDVRNMEEFNKCFNRDMDRKVLIVMDDVDQKGQFDQLIPDINKLGPGSRVIITSRDSNCLVKLDEDRRIVMHDLLRDMGRQVVMNQSHHMEKGTPSHLWDPEMVQRVLQNKEGTNKVRGLSTFGVGHGGNGATNVAENYIGMNRLHFLLLDGDNVKGDFSTWSRELSWLQWMNSNLLALPLELDLRKLAVLDLTSNKELMQIWPNDLEV
ncbi:unnamed protein product [Sphagnum balticum]